MNTLEVAKKCAALLESRDPQGLQAMLTEDFKARGEARELNKPQTLGFLQILFTAFPDHRFGFTDFKQEGDWVHCAGEEMGTHTGTLDLKPFGLPIALPPSGKSFHLPKTKFSFQVAGERISYYVEEGVSGGGLAGILGQLGVNLPQK